MKKSPAFTCFTKPNTWGHFSETLKHRRQLKVDMPVHRGVQNKTLFCVCPQVSLLFGLCNFLVTISLQKAYMLWGIDLWEEEQRDPWTFSFYTSMSRGDTRDDRSLLHHWTQRLMETHNPSPHIVPSYAHLCLGQLNCFLCLWLDVKMRQFLRFYNTLPLFAVQSAQSWAILAQCYSQINVYHLLSSIWNVTQTTACLRKAYFLNEISPW